MLFSLNILFLFELVLNSNLRNEAQINHLDNLLKTIYPTYNSLYKKMLTEKCNISKELSTDYFKIIEANSKTKYYLNKGSFEFKSIIDDIINNMGISNKKYSYILDIFNNQISLLDKNYYNNRWLNFNIITTVRTNENTISFGSLYIIKNGDKYDFIFCYGFGNFTRIFNGRNIVFLDIDQNKYNEISQSYTSSSKDFPYSSDENYLIHFMNLIGLKVLGNKYNINLYYPDFD